MKIYGLFNQPSIVGLFIITNNDMEIFTDGSSFVQDGKHKAGYAMVTAEQVLEVKSLPQGTSIQLAELAALT